MSDPFFQKKRKRSGPSTSSEGGGGRGGGRGGGGGVRSTKTSKAGPSRLRMRERSRRGDDDDGDGEIDNKVAIRGKRGRRRDADAEGDDESDDDDDDDDDGGIEGMDTAHRYEQEIVDSDEDEQETPAEARVRLARMYLDSLREDGLDEGDADAAEIDRQNISSRLQADAATHSTHMHTFVADQLVLPHSSASTDHILACRGHRLSVTCATISPDCSSLWTAGKDGRIVRWRLRDGKMLEMIGSGRKSILANGEWNGHTLSSAKRDTKGRSSSSGAARRRARAKGAQNAAASGTEEGRAQLVTMEAEQGHYDQIWTLAVSHDGKYLVSGGKDRRICVWGLATGAVNGMSIPAKTTFIKALGGHKDSITALRFRYGSHDLFSASLDRTMKLFDISQLSYVETFFGHQEDVAALDVLRAELAVTAGSRDRTLRWWKVRDESQLVFRGGGKSKVREVLEGGDIMGDEGADDETQDGAQRKQQQQQQQQLVEGSIDAVAMVDEHTFLSGGDTGTLSLWSLAKKKPIFNIAAAHGFEDHVGENGGVPMARWITSLACLPYGDVFASGSWDGRIRLWKLAPSLKSFSLLCEVPAIGFVNSLQLLHPTRAIVKRRGGSVISPDEWIRHGGLKGGAKKVFDIGDEDANEAASTTINGHEGGQSSCLIVVAAIGQEMVRGRWHKVKEARNGTLVIPFALKA